MTMDDRPHDPLDPRSRGSSVWAEGPDDVDVVASAIVDGEPLPPGADPDDPEVLSAVAAFRDVAARVGDTGEPVPPDLAAIRAAIAAAAEPEAGSGEDARVVSLVPRRRALSTRVVGIAAALLLAVGVGGIVLTNGDDSQRELSTAGSAPAESNRGDDAAVDANAPVMEDSAGNTAYAADADPGANDEQEHAAASALPSPQSAPSTTPPEAARATAGLIDLGELDSVAAIRAAVQDLLSVTDSSELSSLDRRDSEPRCTTAVAATGTPVAVGRLDGRDVIAVVSLAGTDLTVLHLDDCTLAEG